MFQIIEIGDHRITDPPHTFDRFNQSMQRSGIFQCFDIQRFGNAQC